MAADQIKRLYESMPARLERARGRFGRALTLAEKILVSHADDFDKQEWSRGKAQLRLRVDRVALQDATGQMALLQFMQAGKKQVAVPSTVHCDHLIRAQSGAREDMERAISENREVYNFLHSASKKYGIGFWKPGAGIIHQVVLENYAFPGGLMIGADSHTPNAGGLGMAAIGVGGADCGEAMAGLAWEVLDPKLIGIRLTGKLSGWSSAKDIITYLCGLLTVKGGTNKIIEYFGPGAETISATGKGTICNRGAELGATTSLFHFDDHMAAYLRATDRGDQAALAEAHRMHLVGDPEVLADPKKYFDEVVEINLSELEPHIVGPHSPHSARPVSRQAAQVTKAGWPTANQASLIVLIGFTGNHEIPVEGETENSAEAVVGGRYTYFMYDFPKLTLNAALAVYPSLTISGRVRVEALVSLKREIVSDFYLSLSVFDSYDSRDPTTLTAKNDWGPTVSIGWKF